MSTSMRSKYTVVWTAHLDDTQRQQLLAWAAIEFPASCQLTPGQLISHVLEMRGRNALLLAWEHAERVRAAAEGYPAGTLAPEQGGKLDDER
jgi:hypothetical protein